MLLEPLIKFFTSLKLTVACLAFAIVLVFLGTVAQVDLGLYKAQNEYFRSFLVFWGRKAQAGESLCSPVVTSLAVCCSST